MLDLKMFKKTKLVLFSPGADPKPIVNLAAYTPDFDNIWVSARPNNFPITSVKASVEIDGQQQDIDLTKDKRGFYSFADGFVDKPEPGGIVRVENAAGEITERKIITPAIYASAADVAKYSFAQPVPNGEYLIALGGDPEKLTSLYCLFSDPESGEKLSEPKEYLTLSATDSMSNFVDMIADRDWVRFYWNKIRINPYTLAVYDDDNTFVTEDTVAMDCYECLYWLIPARYGLIRVEYPTTGFDSVYANINLSGTPFKVDTTKIGFNDEEGITMTNGEAKIFDFFSSSAYPGYYSYDFAYGWEGDSLYLTFEPVPKVTGLPSKLNTTVPRAFALDQNYPNPFNPVTTISFNLPERADVKLAVYNMRGQVVRMLLDAGTMQGGRKEVTWNGRNTSGQPVSSGIYVYRLEATGISGDKYTMSKRMVLVK
jgi:hypothetical protein